MPKCPKCGDQAHIYGRADVRWNETLNAWEVGDVEELLECTECDEEFYYGEAGFRELPELSLFSDSRQAASPPA